MQNKITQCPDAPHMSNAEIGLLKKYTPSGGTVLEFGTGGSTKFFLKEGVKRLFSLDSDQNWIALLTQEPLIVPFAKRNQWISCYADIGPVGEWGRPINKTPQYDWLCYHQDIWQSLKNESLDFILIDGRFRVACLCQALLHCDKAIPTLIHDFWPRTHYHSVLEFTEVIDRAESSVVLKRRENIDWKSLCLVLQTHQFDFE